MSCIFIEFGIQGVEILQNMQALELLDLRQELFAALELCVCVWVEEVGECERLCVCMCMRATEGW